MAIPECNFVDIDTPCYPNPSMGRFGKVINLYVQNESLDPTERAAFDDLVSQLPPPMEHGIRTRVWKFWYPDVPYPGLTVGLRDVTVAASNEVLIPYLTFNMANVPWDKLGVNHGCYYYY